MVKLNNKRNSPSSKKALDESAGIPETDKREDSSKSPKIEGSPRINWSTLTDPKAAVIAAMIGAVGLIIGAVIGFGGTYLSEIRKPQREIIVKQAEQDIEDKSAQAALVRKSFDEALKSIQGMKESISTVTNRPHITNGEGSKILSKSRQDLAYAYGGNPATGTRASFIDICGAIPKNCAFHQAKDVAMQALTWVQAQPEKDELSDDARKRLAQYRDQLDTLQKEIAASKSLFIGDTHIP